MEKESTKTRARRSDYKDIDDEVASLHQKGWSNKNIADQLAVSAGTVGIHMKRLGIKPHYCPTLKAKTANNMRQCILCLDWLLPSEFYAVPSKNGKINLQNSCKRCTNKKRYTAALSKITDKKSYYREKYKRDRKYNSPEKARFTRIKNLYKLSRDEYLDLLEKQNNQCRICCKEVGVMNANVDHDHSCCPGAQSCGACVRGILCEKCNWLLGMADDSIDILKRAILYLGEVHE